MGDEITKNTLPTDDVIDEASDVTAQPGVNSESVCLPTSGVRRICVAPASGDDVIQSPEPPETMQCSWRPVKPGYAANVGEAVLIERTVEVEDFDHHDDKAGSFRLAIPVMNPYVAVFCAVCNVIIPGLGELNGTFSIDILLTSS